MVSVLDASVQDGIAEGESLGDLHTTERVFFFFFTVWEPKKC